MLRPGLSSTSWQSRLAVGRGQGPTLRPSTDIENWPSALTSTHCSCGPVYDPGATGQLCQVRLESAPGTGGLWPTAMVPYVGQEQTLSATSRYRSRNDSRALLSSVGT